MCHSGFSGRTAPKNPFEKRRTGLATDGKTDCTHSLEGCVHVRAMYATDGNQNPPPFLSLSPRYSRMQILARSAYHATSRKFVQRAPRLLAF